MIPLPTRPQVALRLRLKLPYAHRVAETSGGVNFGVVLPPLAVDVVEYDERVVVVDRRVEVLFARLEGILHALLVEVLTGREEAVDYTTSKATKQKTR